MFVCIFKHIHIYTCFYMYLDIYVYMCVFVYVYVYIYIYAYICATYIYIYISLSPSLFHAGGVALGCNALWHQKQHHFDLLRDDPCWVGYVGWEP